MTTSLYESWLLEQPWTAPYAPSGITFTDFFCGWGGSSIGLTEAGLQLVWAANHWDLAIENHAANFRHADHYLGDISGFDMRRVPKADVAWLSPECTWHSPAGGRKRIRAELDALFPDDYVPPEAGERSRATMWDVVRAAEAKAFKIVIVENVVEVTSWPLFDAWLHAMEVLEYKHQIVCVSAAHIGDDRNPYAPQWRDRIYFVFYKKQIPFPVIEPRPIAWCSQCGKVVESRQSWKREDRKRIGKYGPQYFYVCASGNHPSFVVEPFVLPASAAIDWSDLGSRICERDKPLAPATMRRIEAGIKMFARPIVTAAAGQTYDAASEGQPRKFYRVVPAAGAPLDPRVTTTGDGVAVPPFATNVRHGKDDHGRQFPLGQAPLPTTQTKIGDGIVVPVGGTWTTEPYATDLPFRTRLTSEADGLVAPPFLNRAYGSRGNREHLNTGIDEPLHPITASGGNHSLIAPPFIAELRGTSTARTVIDDSLSAVTAGGNHHGLTIPDGAFLAEYYGNGGAKTINEPMGTVSTREHHALVIPYRRGKASRAAKSPLPVVTTSRITALLEPEWSADELKEIVANSRFRMLGPLEHGRAQRFPDTYQVHGNRGERTKGFGNAVASNVAHWLGRFCVLALAGHVSREERAA